MYSSEQNETAEKDGEHEEGITEREEKLKPDDKGQSAAVQAVYLKGEGSPVVSECVLPELWLELAGLADEVVPHRVTALKRKERASEQTWSHNRRLIIKLVLPQFLNILNLTLMVQ